MFYKEDGVENEKPRSAVKSNSSIPSHMYKKYENAVKTAADTCDANDSNTSTTKNVTTYKMIYVNG